ncbi:MAG: DUF2177 family protein [Saprospiraceae bacterium]
MKTLFHFLITLAFYATGDLLWLGLIAKGFVRRQVGELMAEKPDWIAAGIFYLIYVTGLLYFCVGPADNAGKAALNGAVLGLVAYGTYELVNKALIRQWPLPLVLVDMGWGIVISAGVSWLSFQAKGWLG